MSAPDLRAVFLSYAHEDAAAAQRIAEALRSQGVEVWFDQNELRGGDAWDQKIRKQIHECALFLPVVSTHTQERGEGYFRREWKLAVERTHDMADGVPFIVPVAVDETPQASALVPEQYTHVQWTRLPGALPTPQFVEQVKRLLAAPRTPAVTSQKLEATSHSPARSGHRVFSMRTVIALGVVVVALVTYVVTHPPAKEAAAPPKPVAETKPAPAAPVASDKSIAVLPFENRSAEKDTAFFTDGIHEDILTNLTRIRELRVVSRTTAMQYRDSKKTLRQIGAELGVAWVLEGSVQRAGNRVHVTGQLIRAATDEHVWANSYDRDLTDIFAIQAELSQAIAGELKAALSPQEKNLLERRPTQNVAAYDLLLKSREIGHSSESRFTAPLKQEALLQSAVQLDPRFAEAWAALADTHSEIFQVYLDRSTARRAKARQALDQAAQLAPEAPATLHAQADYAYRVLRDYPQAAEQFEKIARLFPNDEEVFHDLGVTQQLRGKWDEALAALRRAAQLEPRYARNNVDLRNVLIAGRRYAEAMDIRRVYLKAVRAENYDPNHPDPALGEIQFMASGSTREMEAWRASLTPAQAGTRDSLMRRRHWARVRGEDAEFLRLDALLPDQPDAILLQRTVHALELATLFAAQDDTARARATVEKFPAEIRAALQRNPDEATLWQQLGMIEALLGQKDEALICVGRAVELEPESRDAQRGPIASIWQAMIFAWTGDKDRAFAGIARLMRIPCPAVFDMNVNLMRHDAWWAPLRGDPRFEALLNDPKNNAPLF